jgi:hypothetical protein
MLVLLRQSETKLYYGIHGGWVSKVSVAAHFQTVEEVLLFSHQEHLQGMQVVVLHNNGHKVILPLGKQSWATEHWNAPGSAVHSRNKDLQAPSSIGPRDSHRGCRPNGTGRHCPAVRHTSGWRTQGCG